ncbi:LOW QUALITY PROTEIN: uncharacterized protein EMH_0009300 [Eimeria mitis]|uniref:Uncharacterized protein n=1 Tax=Eimeria mitis TaxID=44415 RepID=U6K7P8_9EIME|nr:LOW QUALITY PROTEIN: uncharacterized protein EMH_0009300 [Eimeria mitis]CDJ31513.1 hypothetical protein, conserved [Eimeria mitis]
MQHDLTEEANSTQTSEFQTEIRIDASSSSSFVATATGVESAGSGSNILQSEASEQTPQCQGSRDVISDAGQRGSQESVPRGSHVPAPSAQNTNGRSSLDVQICFPDDHDNPLLTEALQDPGTERANPVATLRKFQRNASSAVSRHPRAPSAGSRATADASAADFHVPADGQSQEGAPSVGNELRTVSYSAPAAPEARSSGTDTPTAQSSAAAAMLRTNAAREAELHWQAHQRNAASPESASSHMTKSVSPAGVVRIGGRNRRKRTKYDLAYKQMEELGPFEEEAKSVDKTKVAGNSFALELLKNPQQYSHDAWEYGFAWPVGADCRRLLLRKLRGVFWSNPEKWQRVLQEHNLYRRDLFTFATVQELFKVTHLMGAEAWDFLLKCTALTQKCDALTSKELDVGREDEPGSVSPRGTSKHAHHLSSMDACKSEDDVHSPPDKMLGAGLPSSAFLRKRVPQAARADRDANKRSRGRPRKIPVRVQRAASEPEDASEASPTRHLHTGLSTPTSEAFRWLPEAESSNFAEGCRSPFHSAVGEKESSPLQPEEDNNAVGGTDMLETSINEQRRLLASFMSTAPPVTSTNDSFCLPATGKTATSAPELRLALGGKPSNSMLMLTTHYAFMAQFMQCCMLVEVQRSLLRIAEKFKTVWPPNRDLRESSFQPDSGGMDAAARACFDSLVRSSNVHMQFVQVIVEQLQKPASGDPQLQIQHMRDRLMFASPEQAPAIASEVIEALRDMAQHTEHRPNGPAEGLEKTRRADDGGPQSMSFTASCYGV